LDESLAGIPELEGLGPRDRALANELINGTVKRRITVDAVLGAFTKAPLESTEPDVLEALRLATFQMLFLDRVPAHAAVDDAVALLAGKGKRVQGFANAVLRQVAGRGHSTFTELARGGGQQAWSIRYSCPRWLVRLLRMELGDPAAARFFEAANVAPERCVRVNSMKGTATDAAEALAADGFSTSLVPGLPEALIYSGPALERSAPFRAGLVTPQSRGSQLTGRVAADGAAGRPSRVLDLCAAPGIKTGHLAASLPGVRITALDLDPARITALGDNLVRLGVGGVEVVQGDALELPAAYVDAFDAVLLDAPCSGLGTLGSRPDLRWRRSLSDVARMGDLQRQLIAEAGRCVRPGGALTYAVCTLPKAETLAVVDALLEGGGWSADDLGATWPEMAHPDSHSALLVLPPDHGASGFFIARLRREAASRG
ncbi:MAG TPA: transcription antitermination factor NusB, partial [Thermoleophilia bacterium]|nr:transcription antitermination factor NusB [Thermoleophilia bacterium]